MPEPPVTPLGHDDIVGTLAAEIRQLGAGDRIASEHQLMDRFGVSRSLIRTSISKLQMMHLVRRVQGSGTFVNRRLDYVISRSRSPSLHKTVEAAGARCETVLIGYDETVLPTGAAQRIEIDPDTALQRLRRLSHINSLAAMYVEEFIVPGVCEHADVAVGAIRSVDETLRAAGYLPVRAWCRASLDIPPPHARARLELEEHEYTWVVESIARDRDSAAALFYSRTWTRQDAIRLVLEMDDAPATTETRG